MSIRGEGSDKGAWRCSIQRDLFLKGFEVWVYMERANGSVLLMQAGEEAGRFSLVEVEEGGEFPSPTYRGDLGPMIAIAEAVRSMGGLVIQDETRAELKGRLEATSAHLEDMRQLVFRGNAP